MALPLFMSHIFSTFHFKFFGLLPFLSLNSEMEFFLQVNDFFLIADWLLVFVHFCLVLRQWWVCFRWWAKFWSSGQTCGFFYREHSWNAKREWFWENVKVFIIFSIFSLCFFFSSNGEWRAFPFYFVPCTCRREWLFWMRMKAIIASFFLGWWSWE